MFAILMIANEGARGIRPSSHAALIGFKKSKGLADSVSSLIPVLSKILIWVGAVGTRVPPNTGLWVVAPPLYEPDIILVRPGFGLGKPAKIVPGSGRAGAGNSVYKINGLTRDSALHAFFDVGGLCPR